MNLIVNENFQYKGFRKEGTTLDVPESLLRAEIEKGKHPVKYRGEERWISPFLNHCTPANQATADFIERESGESIEPDVLLENETDDSEELREIWAEMESMGKAIDKRLGIVKSRNALIKARKEYAASVYPDVEDRIE